MVSMYVESLAQFGISLLVQVAIWQILLRRREQIPHQILLLFTLYLGFPLVHYFFDPSLDRLILSLGLGCAFIMTFPALAAQSPTLVILDLLDRNPKMTEASLERELNARTALMVDRLKDLKSDGLATYVNGELHPTFAGRTLARIFWTYRRVLGLPMGEG